MSDKLKIYPLVTLAVRILLGGILLLTGWMKVSSPIENFEEILRIYEVFPEVSIYFLARVVPILEILIGAAICLGIFIRLALLGAAIFFTTFITVISRGLILERPIYDCGCFGEWIHMSPQMTLGMDIILLGIALWLLFSKNLPFKVTSLISKD